MNECQSNPTQCVQLSPFSHQVGGHSSMFQYDKETVCKVLDVAEFNFYQSIPNSLKSFTPEFRGIITAFYDEDQLGNIKLLTSDDHSINRTTTNELKSDETNDSINYQRGQIIMSKRNPWSMQLCKKQVEKLHRQSNEQRPISQKFILLENVTARFSYPCILDLKMGKRQHADLESDEKRQSKMEKCQLSTSSTLGVRLCGMQVYQIADDRYIFTDKYRGRMLTVDGFHSALIEYLDNGREKRVEILPRLIERLQSLYETIESLGNYRFYSGSLLIVYDGLTSSNQIDLRMIDFAHSSLCNDSIDPDRDYLAGLEYLIEIFRQISRNEI